MHDSGVDAVPDQTPPRPSVGLRAGAVVFRDDPSEVKVLDAESHGGAWLDPVWELTTAAGVAWIGVELAPRDLSTGFDYDWSPLSEVLHRLGRELPSERDGLAGRALYSLEYIEEPGFYPTGVVTGVAMESAFDARESTDGIAPVAITRISMLPLFEDLLLVARHPQHIVTGKYLELSRGPAPRNGVDLLWTELFLQSFAAWRNSAAPSLADFAVSALTEAARGFEGAVRSIVTQFEQAEQAFFFLMGEAAQPELEDQTLRSLQNRLFQLAILTGRVEAELAAFGSGDKAPPRWYQSGSVGQTGRDVLAARYSENAARVQRLRGDVRATIDMMANTVALQQLRLGQAEQAENERRRAREAQDRARDEAFQRNLAIFAGVVLVPTLIVGFFGANVDFPGRDGETAFWVMLGAIVASVVVGLAVFAVLRRRADRDADGM